MKKPVSKLIVLAAALILCALILFFCLRKSDSDGENTPSSAETPAAGVENVGETDAPITGQPVANAGKTEAEKSVSTGSVASTGSSATAGNAASGSPASSTVKPSAGTPVTGNGSSGSSTASTAKPSAGTPVTGNGSSESSTASTAKPSAGNASAVTSTGSAGTASSGPSAPSAGNASVGASASAGNASAVTSTGSAGTASAGNGTNSIPYAVPVAGAESGAQPNVGPSAQPSAGSSPVAGEVSSALKPADASGSSAASAGQSFSSSRRESAFSDDLSGPSFDLSADSVFFGGSDAYQYFEYQVITVPKKTLAEAAESMGLPKDAPPSDELLPAIYKTGGYRVIGYSAGYSAASTPVEFKMARTEFFPDFYILPNDGGDPGEGDYGMDDAAEDEEDDDSGDANGEDAEEDDVEDEDGDMGGSGDGNFTSYNNLASILPFFGDPTIIGNEFFLDIRPPRFFSMESSLRKLNGFTNTDYGEWGTGQSPIFDDNSFSNMLTATRGKPIIVSQLQSSNAWTLHVFYTRALPMPEKLVPAAESENKLVRLDFQIVRAKWTDLLAAGKTDGSPGLPSDSILFELSDNKQLRDLYSPSFRLVPAMDPVTIQLNAKMQYVPLKWVPAQDFGVPAIPLGSEAIWTGTALRAAARVFNDNSIVRLDYRFEKVSQTGWRNYGYSFFGEPEAGPSIVVQQDRYARPQQQLEPEPEILSGMLKLPMIDTTAFRQALYLEVGKPVLAARISNPAYQPDMLTLLFVTATVEDAP